MMGVVQIEPTDGDVVGVRGSSAPDGQRPQTEVKTYAVIEWGVFDLVADRMASLPKADALLEARHSAAERGKDAWDSTGKQMVRLPRLPLVYRGVADTFVVNLDITDYATPQTPTTWQGLSHLTEAEALQAIVEDGVTLPIAKALLGKAPMPQACS
jgi:hypothetical protein